MILLQLIAILHAPFTDARLPAVDRALARWWRWLVEGRRDDDRRRLADRGRGWFSEGRLERIR